MGLDLGGLEFDPPWSLNHYLGFVRRVTERVVPGRTIRIMTYDMADFVDSCVKKYLALAGPKTFVLKKFSTLFIADDHRESPAGDPGIGLVVECPWR